MARRPAALAATALRAATGCGAAKRPPLDAACTSSAEAIERALERAPAPVMVRPGMRLSDCVAGARSDAELQNAGVVLTGAAEHLADRAKRGDARAGVA